jgi:hypothetical protein
MIVIIIILTYISIGAVFSYALIPSGRGSETLVMLAFWLPLLVAGLLTMIVDRITRQ